VRHVGAAGVWSARDSAAPCVAYFEGKAVRWPPESPGADGGWGAGGVGDCFVGRKRRALLAMTRVRCVGVTGVGLEVGKGGGCWSDLPELQLAAA